jgi:hypothetical protein
MKIVDFIRNYCNYTTNISSAIDQVEHCFGKLENELFSEALDNYSQDLLNGWNDASEEDPKEAGEYNILIKRPNETRMVFGTTNYEEGKFVDDDGYVWVDVVYWKKVPIKKQKYDSTTYIFRCIPRTPLYPVEKKRLSPIYIPKKHKSKK